MLAFLAAGAAVFVIQAVRSINVQQDIQYPECAVVFGVVNLWHGGSLYHDFHNPPFAVISYPPVFYVISAVISKLFARSIYSVYVCGRVVALSATVLTAITVAAVARRAKTTRLSQISAPLLFLGSSLLLPWGFMARVDSLMLCFTMIGLFLFIKFNRSNWQYLAVLAFVLAIFTKQSALAAPAAAVVTLAFQRKWKESFLFAAALIFLSVACFLIGNYMTDGSMSLNIIGGIDAPARAQSIIEVFRRSFSGLFMPIVLSALALAAFIRKKPLGFSLTATDQVIFLFGIYLLGSLALAAVSSTKLGSDRNYYLDSLLAASVLGGFGIEWLADQSRRRWLYAILAISLVVCVGLPDFINQKYEIMTSNYFVSADNSAVLESLRPLSGDILIQDANIALRLEKPVFVTDPYHLAVMISTGRWSAEPLIKLIEQKHFQAVVLPFDLDAAERPYWASYQGLPSWDARILNAINVNYELADEKGGVCVYHKR